MLIFCRWDNVVTGEISHARMYLCVLNEHTHTKKRKKMNKGEKEETMKIGTQANLRFK